MKRLAVSLVAVLALMGAKSYNKDQAAKEAKQHLLSLCKGDARCTEAVQTHFPACFERSCRQGERRQAARLEAGPLVQCINSRSGRVYFTYKAAEGGSR